MGTDTTTPPPEGPAALPPRPPLPRRCWQAVARRCRDLWSHPGRLVLLVALLVALALGARFLGTRLWASHHFRAAREALDRYHNRVAVEHLKHTLTVWPDDPEVLFLAARPARRLGEFEQARGLLDRGAGAARMADEVALERVLLRAARGELDQVGRYCRALLDRGHPASSLIYEALVRGSLETFRAGQAKDYLDEWLKREPDNPQALLF